MLHRSRPHFSLRVGNRYGGHGGDDLLVLLRLLLRVRRDAWDLSGGHGYKEESEVEVKHELRDYLVGCQCR